MANEKVVDREVLKAFRERLDERYVMEGEYSPETSVGYSDSTGAIKTEYGVELNAGATIDGHLDEPFLFRPTAYPFNRDIITIGGQKATVKEVRAYAFVKNQLVLNGDFSNGTTGWGAHWYSTGLTAQNNVLTALAGAANPTLTCISQSISGYIIGHKYLAFAEVSNNGSEANRVTFAFGDTFPLYQTITTSFKFLYHIITVNNTLANVFGLLASNQNATEQISIQVKRIRLIDLTQWFNNDTTILSKTNETWFIPWFLNNFGKYIPTYSTGEIENTYATKITTNGVNQWDGTNDIRVLPKTQYYCKGSATLTYKDIDGNTIDTATVSDAVFTTPDNCIYVGVSGSGNIQICLHWTETEIEQTYHPYEKWVFNIDWSAIGTPLGINSRIGDYKDFVNGKNGKVVGSVDLWTLAWNSNSGTWPTNSFYALTNYKALSKTLFVDNGNIILSITVNSSGHTILTTNSNYANPSAVKTAVAGVILQYELAEPTLTDMTESEKLTNTYNVNDYGTEGFDEVCALDVLYQNNLVRQIVNNQTAIADHEQRIGALETEVEGITGLPTAPSTNGNYRLRCTVTDGVATYTWVEES